MREKRDFTHEKLNREPQLACSLLNLYNSITVGKKSHRIRVLDSYYGKYNIEAKRSGAPQRWQHDRKTDKTINSVR